MKKYLEKIKNKKGFTLVEIIVVLAILAILIAVAVPSMAGALQDARDKTSMSDARAAYIAYELKSTTGTPTLADIKDYLGKTDINAISVKLEGVGTDNKKVTHFYYNDANLNKGKAAKYILITAGDKATIVTGAFPTTDVTPLP